MLQYYRKAKNKEENPMSCVRVFDSAVKDVTQKVVRERKRQGQAEHEISKPNPY